MEYLQYKELEEEFYKVIKEVLNLIINGIPSIRYSVAGSITPFSVLNLIINGIPSILKENMTYNSKIEQVLNLIINGIPSIHNNWVKNPDVKYGFKPYYKWNTFNTHVGYNVFKLAMQGFKPYYKWNTFNTMFWDTEDLYNITVLNLIINGIPSIQ